MSQQAQQQRVEEGDNHMDTSGGTTSNANDLNELKLKMAALEVIWEQAKIGELQTKNGMLEAKNKHLEEQMKPDVLWNSLIQGKRLINPKGNRWSPSNPNVEISSNGLMADDKTRHRDYLQHVYAMKEFSLSVALCREANFPGGVLYYFEVTQNTFMSYELGLRIGLSDGAIPYGVLIGNQENSYAIRRHSDYCFISGRYHDFDWPVGAIQPEFKPNNTPGDIDILGCGICLDRRNRFSIFFTGNGILLGKQIPLNHPGDRLFPTVRLYDSPVVANFGEDLVANPFSYNIHECPGLVFE